MPTGRKDRSAQIAAHAAFYFITVILDALRRKGLMSADEIARAIDDYPHEDADLQEETRAFLHRCMELIETVPASPPTAPVEEGTPELDATDGPAVRSPSREGGADELVHVVREKDLKTPV